MKRLLLGAACALALGLVLLSPLGFEEPGSAMTLPEAMRSDSVEALPLDESPRLRKSRDASGSTRVHVSIPGRPLRTLEEWRADAIRKDAALDPTLRRRIATADPSTELSILVFHRERPAARIAREVQERHRRDLRVAAELVSEARRATDAIASVRSTEEERHASTFQAAEPLVRDAVASLDRIRSVVRTELEREVRAATEGPLSLLEARIAMLGGRVTGRIPLASAVSARVSPSVAWDLSTDPAVSRIEIDDRLDATLDVSQAAIGAPAFWGAGYDGGAMDLAIVDTGIDATHPALAAKQVEHGVFLAASGNPVWDRTEDDVNGHGTHLAGIVASLDVVHSGTAFGIDRLFNVKAAADTDGSDGGGATLYYSDSMRGVTWATTHPIDAAEIVSLSYGTATQVDDSAYMRFWDAVASDLDVSVVMSAGNSGPGAGTVQRPGIAANSICVANVDDRGTPDRADDDVRISSSRGPTPFGRRKPDLAAPGTAIRSTNNNWEAAGADWVEATGTSMATPHVAGALALLGDAGVVDALSRKALLINTAEDRGDAGWDPVWGFGYVDLAHAIAHLEDVRLASIEPEPDARLWVGPALTGDRATLVWNRRVTYNGSAFPRRFFALSDLDLFLFAESNGDLLDSDETLLDNVQQVEAPVDGRMVLKVDAAASAFFGATEEVFALATEESFVPVDPTRVTVAFSAPEVVRPGTVFSVEASLVNESGAAMHDVTVTLGVPEGFEVVEASATRSYGLLPDGNTRFVAWELRAGPEVGEMTISVGLVADCYGESFEDETSADIEVTDGGDGVGIFDLREHSFGLRDLPAAGAPDIELTVDPEGAIPISGDWNGDGVDTVGLYSPATGRFALHDTFDGGAADRSFEFGAPNLRPLAGDWDGDGVDTIGVFDPVTATFFLRDSNSEGPADLEFVFGYADAVPFAGDWNGDGRDTIAVQIPATATYLLRDRNAAGLPWRVLTFGEPGHLPIAGDWNADGVDTIGSFDAKRREFRILTEDANGPTSRRFSFGEKKVMPLVGDWDGD